MSAAKERQDVEDELERRSQRGAKPFIFFLDDFPCEMPETRFKDMHPLMRNVFCLSGLVVIVSSASGTAQNLAGFSATPSGRDAYLWCIVYPVLPRTVIDNDIGVPPLVFKIIKTVDHFSLTELWNMCEKIRTATRLIQQII